MPIAIATLDLGPRGVQAFIPDHSEIMELYLVQHGQAKAEDEDPGRPLTDLGRKEVLRVADWSKRQGVRVSAIYHSGKLRARATAEIFADALEPELGSLHMEGLGPKDDPAATKQAVKHLTTPVMLVGHLPHLGRLASLLVADEPAQRLMTFQPGSIVCLGGQAGVWRVRWTVPPEMAV